MLDAMKWNLFTTDSIKGINDLVVSPVNPLILASASEDLTVRIWSLEAQHAAKPCAAILAGGAHQAVLLSIVGCLRFCCYSILTRSSQAFHPSARYLLSSGDDQAVNLVRFRPSIQASIVLTIRSGLFQSFQTRTQALTIPTLSTILISRHPRFIPIWWTGN